MLTDLTPIQALLNPHLAREARSRAAIVNINDDQRDRWQLDDLLAEEQAVVSEDDARQLLSGVTKAPPLDEGGPGAIIPATDLEFPLRIGLGRRGDGCYGFFRARLYGEKFERTFMRFAAAPTYDGAQVLWKDIYAQTSPISTLSHPGFGVRPPWIAYRSLDLREKHPSTPAITTYGHWLAVALAVVWFRDTYGQSP